MNDPFEPTESIPTEAASVPQLFDPRDVLVAAEKKYGPAAAWMDVESVWAMLALRSSNGGAK